MLPDLFRIRHGEDHGRRPAMAEFHRTRRVLPERPAADMDRMVHAAPPALVPCSDGVWNAGSGRPMAKETSPATFCTKARRDGGDAHVDFLCHARANGVDGQAVAASDHARVGAGAVSHREPLWTVCGDDARPL